MNYFPISRLLFGLATLFTVLVLTGCATGPSERRIELVNVVRDAAGASPRWQPAEPAQVGLRVWRNQQEVHATRGMQLLPGDEVQTGAQSAAVIGFSGGPVGAGTGTVAVDENSRVRVGSLEVFFGRIFANVRGLFETTSENVVAGVEGTRFLFEVTRDRKVRVAVAQGVVSCSSRDGSWQSVSLQAGQALVSAYPNRARPQVMPADPRELRDLEDWAAQVAAPPAASPPPALFAPFFNFGFGIGGGRDRGGDDWQDRNPPRDPPTRRPN